VRPPAQQERWLAPAIRGEKIAALAITEPDTGSDVAAIRTRAEKVDGGWVVNGAKTFITGGVRADFYVTAVRTRPEPGHGACPSSSSRPPGASARARWRSSAGTPPTRPRSRSRTSRCPTTRCSARRAAASTW
jgi:alkylation response protein AidB-like acyl-CoA dehydrogenase